MKNNKYSQFAKKTYSRSDQISRSFKVILSEYFTYELELPNNYKAFVVDVKINPSLSFVDITISSSDNMEEILTYLNEHNHEIRKICTQKMKHMKYSPQLRFHADTLIDELLKCDQYFNL